MESIIFATISMLAIAGNSLAANRIFQTRNKLNASSATSLSLLPAFIISLAVVPFLDYQMNISEVTIMFAKNAMYGLAFFLRLEGIRKLGAFGGAVLLTAQPILISLFAWVILDESLGLGEFLAISLTVVGLILINKSKPKQLFSISEIFKFLSLPAVLLSLVMIVDRHLLIGKISGLEFFFVDKLTLLPAFLICMMVFNKVGVSSTQIKLTSVSRGYLLKYLFVLGGLWAVSSLFYGLALELEKTVWVAIIRSLAFPLVAVVGSIRQGEAFNQNALIGLILVSIGSILCSIW